MEAQFKENVIRRHIDRTSIPMPVVVKRLRGLDQVIQICIETGKPVVAPEPVDEVLHDALLFTEGYKNHCLQKYGKEIHHKPATIPGQPSGYLETRKLAETKFGPLDQSVWPLSERPQWSIIYTLD